MTCKPIHRLAFLLAALALLAVSRAEPAAAAECYDSNGLPRECTYTERTGECFWSADDSYSQCLLGSGGYWGDVSCTLAWEIDYAACGVESFGRFALALFTPAS
jgi:hypothetical protein